MRFAFLLLVCVAAYGQTKAQLSGFIQDRSGAVIREAAVSVVHMDTGTRRAVRSNGEGFYAVSSLAAGLYKITVRKEGFQTVARVNLPLQATEAARFDFTLDIGSIQQVITVEGAQPMIQSDDATSGVQMGSDPARALPLNGRGLQGMVELAPGVLPTPANAGEAGQFSTNGQRANTNYFTVDGVSANNGVSGSGLPGQFSGGALPAMTAIGSLHTLVALGELQELRVQTSSFAPEFGRLPGAHVAVTTRSGSNEMHGELSAGFRNRAGSASDWFANRVGLPTSASRFSDIGTVVGGPIQRDRLFGFASFERLDLSQIVSFDTAVPAFSMRRQWLSVYPQPNGPELGRGIARHTAQVRSPSTVMTGSGRVDRSLGETGMAFVRYNRAPSSSESGYLQRTRADFSSQSVTAGVITVAASGRLTNDARVGMTRMSASSSWYPGVAGNLDLDTILPNPATTQRLYGLSISGLPPLVTGDPGQSRQTQWNFIDTIALPRGRHDLRFGIDYQRLTPTRENDIAAVLGEYQSIDDVIGGRPAITYAQASAGSSLIESFSAFAQDTWHVTPRLNLTYGTRWEWTPPPTYKTPVPLAVVSPTPILAAPQPGEPAWRTRYTQFAPRLGAAYRLTEDGSLVLRAGAGIFYDLGFSSATNLLNGAPYNRWRNLFVPTIGADGEAHYGLARNLRLPYSFEWNTTLERGLGRDAAVSAAYVGSAGRRLLRREANIAFPPMTPALILATNHGSSNYHSLQLQARSRSRRSVQGVVSYTWSRSIDNGSWDSGTFAVFPELGPGQDRGRSNFDARHNFQAALAYRLPKNWLVSGFLRARSGFPIDISRTENAFGLGFDNLRPDLAGVVWLADPGAPGGRRLNPAAFRTSVERQGNLGRNAIEGFGLSQLDLALERQWAITERANLRLRVEAYNTTNRASFADPVRSLPNPLFGLSTAPAGLMLGAGRPNSGLTPAFQPGGPRAVQAGFTISF